ncbi:MAG TPA: hypothetical protein VGG02_02610 [Chthoniobacterales bacterium]
MGWAVLASLLLHFLVALSLVAFSENEKAAPEENDTPDQLTIMQEPEATPPPLAPKNTMMTTVDPANKSAIAPNEKTFEANENSIAAATKAAQNQNYLPSQDGKDRPQMNLETHEQTFEQKGAQPQPKPKATPMPTATPNESPSVTPTPSPDMYALLAQTPTPIPAPSMTPEEQAVPTPSDTSTPEPTEAPPKPASDYRDFQEQTVIRGGINNRGRSAVNAVGTPLGRYKKALEDAIGSRWYYYINSRRDLVVIGTTTITFDIAPDGSVANMHMTENTTSEATAGIALRSIQETKFPPIPEDLLPTLPEGHFTMEESFTIFANQ